MVLRPAKVAPLGAGHDHAIVDVPFTALIDGRRFRGRGLSLVSAHVTGLMGTTTAGTPHTVRLVFEFSGFAITLEVLALVRDATDAAGGVVLDFTEPSGPHLPQLRHILNAYIAGDLVALGEVIGVAGTTPPKPARVIETGQGRRTLQGSGIVALTVLLVGLSAGLIYQRNYVRLLPDLGTVMRQGETLRATASGQIAFVDLTAPMGQVALAITTTSGDVLSLTMPCDCTANSLGLAVGSTVLAGEPVLQVAQKDAALIVAGTVPLALGFDLARGDQVELALPDGTRVLADLAQPTRDLATFIPRDALPDALIGQPVQVRLIRESGLLTSALAQARHWVLNLSGSI